MGGSFVITAVDTGTETLTAAGHGLLTGGRCRVRNVGGALPTGLTAATDYFAIRVSASDFRLATNSANALAGTPINLTGAGSGTNTVEYGLPYCIPDAISVDGVSQVKSLDLNGSWNALVALYSLLVGVAQTVWTGITLAAGQHVTLQGTGLYKRGTRMRHLPGSAGQLTTAPAGGVTYYVGELFGFRANTDVARWTIWLEEGEQLQSVHGYVSCGPTDVITMKVYRSTQVVGNAASSQTTQLGSTQTSAGHATVVEQLSVTGLTETAAAGLTAWHVEFACTAFATGPRVACVDYTTVI